MWRGRRIGVPEGEVRPTGDRVREAWLSIVHPQLDGARVLDLCAGTGALGLEAISRGARSCDFVEKDPIVRRGLQENIATLGAVNHCSVHPLDAVAFLALPAEPWDVAFADPPYSSGIARKVAERWLAAPFAAILGIEHAAAEALPLHLDGREPDRRVYGLTAITFYRT